MLSESVRPDRGRNRLRTVTGRAWLAALVAAALSCMLASCSQAGSAAHAPAAQSHRSQRAVFARALTGIGMTLVDRSGRTIYSPEQEANGNIMCTGSCLMFWFPVTARTGTALDLPAGFAGKLGKIRRPDNGQTQLTYNGKPLYTFRLDTAAGQAHGNNFTDHFGSASFTWQAVTAAGRVAAKTSPSPPPAGY
jgi:predicted lipoprotein with Yx(FWY)xxD motif